MTGTRRTRHLPPLCFAFLPCFLAFPAVNTPTTLRYLPTYLDCLVIKAVVCWVLPVDLHLGLHAPHILHRILLQRHVVAWHPVLLRDLGMALIPGAAHMVSRVPQEVTLIVITESTPPPLEHLQQQQQQQEEEVGLEYVVE